MSKRKLVIGVMGQGEPCPAHIADAAHRLGELVAQQGWYLLSGGRDAGVMDAVSKGARAAGGLTIGILPFKDSSVSEAVDIAIFTDLGSGRNNVNVLSSDFVVSVGMGSGTSSEISLALKAGKHVILLHSSARAAEFYSELSPKLISIVSTPEDAVKQILSLL